jgi:site-specific recombinase XerC
MEQGQDRRPEGAVQDQGDLGSSRSPSDGSRLRDLALFNLGIDSKLRGCDLVSLKVRDICHGDQVATRVVVMQNKTQRPVQFEITAATCDAMQTWIKQAGLKSENFVFPSSVHDSPHLGTRQYARILGAGSMSLDLTLQTTARTPCGGPRRR